MTSFDAGPPGPAGGTRAGNGRPGSGTKRKTGRNAAVVSVSACQAVRMPCRRDLDDGNGRERRSCDTTWSRVTAPTTAALRPVLAWYPTRPAVTGPGSPPRGAGGQRQMTS